MRITKLGHSCLLIEENNARILTDPGLFSSGHENLINIDAILITHEHPDHCDPESLFTILSKNPSAIVYTNSGVAEILKKAGIPYRLLEHNQSTIVKDVNIEGFGENHAIIYPSIPVAKNTGYLIGNRIFTPGDSYTIPGKQIEILALPVWAPWLKISEAIDYAKQVKPKVAFPIHDSVLNTAGSTVSHKWPGQVLPEAGIEWIIIENGESKEF